MTTSLTLAGSGARPSRMAPASTSRPKASSIATEPQSAPFPTSVAQTGPPKPRGPPAHPADATERPGHLRPLGPPPHEGDGRPDVRPRVPLPRAIFTDRRPVHHRAAHRLAGRVSTPCLPPYRLLTGRGH